jgi:diacylglycerol kinase (ATP)
VPRRIALLVNPTAGKGRAAHVVAKVAAELRAADASVEILVGADAADAVAIAKQQVELGVDALVALGGDGMANLALQAVAGTPIPFGLVAAGTGNDLAAALGVPTKDPVAGARLIADLLQGDGTRPMDAVLTEYGWFGCVLGSGFDSRVNDRANRMTWPKGKARYNLAILAELRVFKPMPFVVTVDGERIETEAMLVAVGNAASYGAGIQVCPDALIDDGLLDVTIGGPMSKLEFLRLFPKFTKGGHRDHPAVRMLRGRVIRIESPGVNAYADGEYTGPLPITCTVEPGAVQVLAPR